MLICARTEVHMQGSSRIEVQPHRTPSPDRYGCARVILLLRHSISHLCHTCKACDIPVRRSEMQFACVGSVPDRKGTKAAPAHPYGAVHKFLTLVRRRCDLCFVVAC